MSLHADSKSDYREFTPDNLSIIKLFLIFVKIGAILLGGGFVILPIVQNEFASKKNYISNEDLINYFALSQTLPGIIAINMSLFIGYKLKGKLGALTAILGILFFPFWTIVFLVSILETVINNSYIQSALWGVGIAVIALITLTIREIWQNSAKDIFFYVIFLSSLVSLLVFKFSPIQVIMIFTVMGILLKKFWRYKK